MENNNIFTDDFIEDGDISVNTDAAQIEPEYLFTDDEDLNYMRNYNDDMDDEDDVGTTVSDADREVEYEDAIGTAARVLKEAGYAINADTPPDLIRDLFLEEQKPKEELVNTLNMLYQSHKDVILNELQNLVVNSRSVTSTNITSVDEILSEKVHEIIYDAESRNLSRQQTIDNITELYRRDELTTQVAAQKFAREAYDRYMCDIHDARREYAELSSSDTKYLNEWEQKVNDIFVPFTSTEPIRKFNNRNGKLYCNCPMCDAEISMKYTPFLTLYYNNAYNIMSAIKCPSCNASLHVAPLLAMNKLKRIGEQVNGKAARNSNYHLDFPVICHYEQEPNDYLYDIGQTAQSVWKIRHPDLRSAFDDYRYAEEGQYNALDIMLQRVSTLGSVDIITSIVHNIYGVCRILDSNFSDLCISNGYELSVKGDKLFVDNVDKFDLIGSDLQDVLKMFKCSSLDELRQFTPKETSGVQRTSFINDLEASWTFASVVRPVTTLKAEIALTWLTGDTLEPIITCAKMATLLQNADVLYGSAKEQAALNYATLDDALALLKRTKNTEIIRHYYDEFSSMGTQDDNSSAPLTVSSYATRYKPMCIPLFGALCVHESTYAQGECPDDYTVMVKDHLKADTMERVALLVCKNYYSEIAPHLNKICENETYTAWNIPDYKNISSDITRILAEEKVDEDTYGFSNPKFVVEELRLQTGEEW